LIINKNIMEDKAITSTGDSLPQPLGVLLQSTVNSLEAVIATIEAKKFNSLSGASGWTAAQQLEHLRLSVTGAIPIINGLVKKTERAPDQFVKSIKDLFLDFEAKYPSAKVLVPENKEYDKDTLTTQALEAYQQLSEAIQTLDLTDTCLATEFTGIGYLTRLEWVTVAIYHTQRHVVQLKSIVSELKDS
jgi:hypothetical protein